MGDMVTHVNGDTATLQRCLRVDMGLPLGGPLPEPTCRNIDSVSTQIEIESPPNVSVHLIF